MIVLPSFIACILAFTNGCWKCFGSILLLAIDGCLIFVASLDPEVEDGDQDSMGAALNLVHVGGLARYPDYVVDGLVSTRSWSSVANFPIFGSRLVCQV